MSAERKIRAAGVEVDVSAIDAPDTPHCAHGPTALFSRTLKTTDGKKTKRFYACTAFRDRKLCSFYQADGAKKATSAPDGNDSAGDAVDKRGKAQFLFSQPTLRVLLDVIRSHPKSKVLCIGAPTLYAALTDPGRSVLCLDLDPNALRGASRNGFCRYNMFNHHFFSAADRRKYDNFVKAADHPEHYVIVIDPPFGGMLQLLSRTLSKIAQDTAPSKVDVILCLPFFLEKKVEQHLPKMSMIDYEVTYANHRKLAEQCAGAQSKRRSFVRIFTTLSPSSIPLPASEDYWFCHACKRYRANGSQHCKPCGTCPRADGSRYRHCADCKRCVKVAFSHCASCSSCHLPAEKCYLS